jgi:hypothetical protein
MPNFGGLTIGMTLLKIELYLEFIGSIHIKNIAEPFLQHI